MNIPQAMTVDEAITALIAQNYLDNDQQITDKGKRKMVAFITTNPIVDAIYRRKKLETGNSEIASATALVFAMQHGYMHQEG
jgi:hypothetical protein